MMNNRVKNWGEWTYDYKWNLCINLNDQFKGIEWITVEREKKTKE